MRLSDYLIIIGIAILLFFAVRYAYRHRHSDCGGNCANCPYHGNCERKDKK